MTLETRAPLTAGLILATALLACLSLATAASAAGAKSTLPTESMQAYEQQLAAGQIKGVVLIAPERAMHLTLADGKRVLVHYPAHDENAVLAALKARGITAVGSKGKPVKPARPIKHKLRYIVGGAVLIVIAIAVAVVLLIRRRRRAAAADY